MTNCRFVIPPDQIAHLPRAQVPSDIGFEILEDIKAHLAALQLWQDLLQRDLVQQADNLTRLLRVTFLIQAHGNNDPKLVYVRRAEALWSRGENNALETKKPNRGARSIRDGRGNRD